MKKVAGIVWVFLAGLAGFSGVLAAQEAPAYGVTSVSTYVVTAWDMQVTEPTVGWSGIALENGHRYATSAGGFVAGASLPQGARILSIELEACDTSATGAVTAILFRTTATGPSTILASTNTGAVSTPGCDGFGADLPIPETVENNANKYVMIAANSAFDGSTTIGAIRIRYQLQVSPAPGTATFNDVPTSDRAFQFIEALVASGITVGCGSGNYCPDAPLTRRQMAVFMSKALGLHWPDGPQF
jgi:hypothetical protein